MINQTIVQNTKLRLKSVHISYNYRNKTLEELVIKQN